MDERTAAAFTASHWGTYRVATDEQDRLTLTSFEKDPDPSLMGNGMLETLDDPCRIGSPMIRRDFLKSGRNSDRALRGKDGFVEVSWDFALDLAAAELDRVRNDYGNEAIYAGSYGWASAGRFHHAQSQLRRFMNLFGGSVRSRDSYSYAAAEVILPHIVGSMANLLQEHTSWRSIREGGSLVVAFGGMALRNGQVNSGGAGQHTQRQDMCAAKEAGVQFVNISPCRDDVIPELEADWIAIRPGADMALMLALAHILVRDDLYNKDFLSRCCVGFDLFLPYLMGTDGQVRKDANWAEKLTGIASVEIEALAQRMAKTPTLVNASWSLTRQQNGEQTYWMLVVLAAMLGGIGRAGEGFGLGLGATNGVGSDRSRLPWAALPSGPDPLNSFIPVARIADMLLNPGAEYKYNGENRVYPHVRMVYWAGGNPFHHHQDLKRLRRAWQNVETVIVHEPHWTPTARHADIVFPATLGMERNDIAASSRDDWLIASCQVKKPFQGARNDHDIFAGLAGRLTPCEGSNQDFEGSFTAGRDEAQWLRELYDQSREKGELLGHSLPDFDSFWKEGTFRLSPPEDAQTLLKYFVKDPAAHPLATPSGLIEIFSQTIAEFDLAGQPGYPVWHEPEEWLGRSGQANYPLHLITHQPDRRLHSQLDHSSNSRAGKIWEREPCKMSPNDAAARSLVEGDMVRLYNERGSCLSAVQIDPSVSTGVVMMATGAWYDPDDDDNCKHGNPNCLTTDIPTSELAQGPSALTCLIEIEKFIRDIPKVTAFIPPKIEAGAELGSITKKGIV